MSVRDGLVAGRYESSPILLSLTVYVFLLDLGTLKLYECLVMFCDEWSL